MNIFEMRANAVKQVYTEQKEENIRQIDNTIKKINKSDLGELKGVGPATIKALIEKDIKTQEDLKEVGIEKVKAIITNPMSLKAILKFFNN